MTDEGAAQVKLIFAPEWPSKATFIDELQLEGGPREWLLRCEEEGHDGTRLGSCVKLYIPRPAAVEEGLDQQDRTGNDR